MYAQRVDTLQSKQDSARTEWLARLEGEQTAIRAAQERLGRHVIVARNFGATWREIASALGNTQSTVYARYSPLERVHNAPEKKEQK